MPEEEYLRVFGKTREQMLADTKKEIEEERKKGNKKLVKQLVEKFKKAFVGDDVFWAYEVGSNIFVGFVMLALMALLLITIGLSVIGLYEFNNMDLITHVAVSIVMLLIGVLVCFSVKGQRVWMKYVLMVIMCLTIATSSAVLGYRADISLTIPIILSTKYLSEKLTKVTAVFSAILMCSSTILTTFVAVAPDLNMTKLAPGTVLDPELSLQKAVEASEILVGPSVRAQLMLRFLPNLLQFLVIAFICITIAKWGHKMVVTQSEVAKEFARVDTELTMAKEIQEFVLPNIFPAFPERSEFDIYATMDAAKEVGGDFYDFFLVDENHLALVMADVSGKGMPAALFMMIGKALIKNQAMLGNSPEDILYVVNNQLCENNETGLFITCWLGILEISTGKLTAANAGHEYPIMKKADDEYVVIKDKHGFVLAGMEGTRYSSYEIQLEKGDKFFVFTDGITEATDSNEKLYGRDRLLKALNEVKDKDSENTVKEIRHSIDLFVGKAPQFDDITMMSITYLGN